MGALGAVGAGERTEYLWPCNVATWGHWLAVQTQWRMGMGGPTGLDYAGVCAYLDESGLRGSARRDAFAGIRAAERGSLDGWASAAAERERAPGGRP